MFFDKNTGVLHVRNTTEQSTSAHVAVVSTKTTERKEPPSYQSIISERKRIANEDDCYAAHILCAMSVGVRALHVEDEHVEHLIDSPLIGSPSHASCVRSPHMEPSSKNNARRSKRRCIRDFHDGQRVIYKNTRYGKVENGYVRLDTEPNTHYALYDVQKDLVHA